ncbi:hypothetical protein Anas_14153, partial [Armadillidium nasatum]
MKAVILLAFLFVTVMCKPIDYEDVENTSEDTNIDTDDKSGETTEKSTDNETDSDTDSDTDSAEDTTDKVEAADTEYEDVVSTTEGSYDAETDIEK